MYRVFNLREQKWVENAIMFPTGMVAVIVEENSYRFINEEDYVLQLNTATVDCNNVPIFEGDICESTDKKDNRIGTVAYDSSFASYFLMDFENKEYLPIGNNFSSHYKVVDNVFHVKRGEQYGKRTHLPFRWDGWPKY